MPSKQEILAEIARTATANGGAPVGMARFEQETGIKPYDWGKFWPRFSDAQKEAGFKATEMQGAHADTFLVEKLIELMRKLGKFPTSREIDVAHHTDPTMPTKKAFQRLGTKERLVHMVITYCNGRSEFEDVLALCRVVSGNPDIVQISVDDVSVSEGEVYLLKSGRYYKIGRTSDTVRRGNEIRVQLPEKMTLIHSIKTDDPSGIEVYWHRRFEPKRMNGEWFDLEPADIKAFKRWRRIS